MRLQNITLRITFSKTLRVLLPVASFIITQHAYIYMEILDIYFFSPMVFITMVISALISSFFLVYSYAIVMNGKAMQLYSRDIIKLNATQDETKRFYYLEKISWESMYFGFAFVNCLYLGLWVISAFGILRYMTGLFGYILSTIIACSLVLALAEWTYGTDD